MSAGPPSSTPPSSNSPASGYAGTSTDAIATRAGISQPYLFRLFGTKKDLFIATYDVVSSRIEEAFVAAADGLEGEAAMTAMGLAYLELLQDPDLLQVQLHGFVAAAADPDIAARLPGDVPPPVAAGLAAATRRWSRDRSASSSPTACSAA